LGRFFRLGHTPASVSSGAGAAFAPREWANPDFPFTLDLRRSG